MTKRRARPPHPRPKLAVDLSIIRGPFAAWMTTSGYPTSTVRLYQLSLERVASWLSRRKRSIADITGEDVPVILQSFFLRLELCRTKIRHRAALHAWLRFRGLPRTPANPRRSPGWHAWLAGYDQYLANNVGLCASTRAYRNRYAKLLLTDCFGHGRVCWLRVRPADVWRCAERFAHRVKPSSAGVMLSSLRSLLRYASLHGGCRPELALSVPQVANYGSERPLVVLSDRERRRLLALPPERRRADGRDRAMVICMLELGLRASDVAQLRLGDFDDRKGTLRVLSPKTGTVRWIPLPATVHDVLRSYVQTRPPAGCDGLFLRIHPPSSAPATPSIVRAAARRAYGRCGFPESWTGTHRLRHTFASRLYARGASLFEIGSMLGHKSIDSSARYAHTDVEALRSLAQPWPR